MKEKAFLSVVVYVYNAENTIESFLATYNKILSEQFENFEIILVNDDSTDRTVERIEKAGNPNLMLVDLSWHHKTELAMVAGSDLAMGDFVLEVETSIIDYPPEMILDLFRKCKEGTDVVSACPSQRIGIFSRLFYAIFNRISEIPITVRTERMRIISRRALNRILSSKEKIRYRKAMMRLSGFPFEEVLYKPSKEIRQVQTEKSFPEKLDTAFEIVLIHSSIGTKLSFYIAFFFLLLSVAIGTYAVFIRFILKSIVPGWTTLVVVITFGFSGLFLVLGILSKYVTYIMTEVKKAPLYSVKSVKRLAGKFQQVF
jgi:dolichol-phosphate mannosyltransferase